MLKLNKRAGMCCLLGIEKSVEQTSTLAEMDRNRIEKEYKPWDKISGLNILKLNVLVVKLGIIKIFLDIVSCGKLNRL